MPVRYRHLLACTDGSPRARKAVAAAAKLAGLCGAKLTVLFVIPPYVLPAYGEAALYIPGVTPHLYKQRADALAKKVLAPAARLARQRPEMRDAGSERRRALVGHLHPARAHQRKCDLIVMASHGRRGFRKSCWAANQRVLTHTRIPVLVVR